MTDSARPIRVAILDLYNGEPNQGMRCIREMLDRFSTAPGGFPLVYEVFETRLNGALPDRTFDIYISTGGPGSPFDGIGSRWETHYFLWLAGIWDHNQRVGTDRKHVFFICHSFQMMCRFFAVGRVCERKSESFGVFPVHMTPAGTADPLFAALGDPFFAADFRHYQVIDASEAALDELGARILCFEKRRPRIRLPRAAMAIRISEEIVGVQFHPEADPAGMTVHFSVPARRRAIIEQHGMEKYERIMHRLEDPLYLARTHDAVIPNFLRQASLALRPAEQATEA